MSLYLDITYFNQVSFSLQLCKQRDTHIWNFRCPICGDSQKNKYKTRGYVYKNGDSLGFTCHNCSSTIGFSGLLKHLNPFLHKEYLVESFLEKNGSSRPIIRKEKKVRDIVVTNRLPFDSIDELPNDHVARKWFEERKIPREWAKDMYYVEHFQELGKEYLCWENKACTKEKRVIIPVWAKDGALDGVVCRDLENVTDRKYVNLKTSATGSLLFGLERLNKNKTIYVTEGPIDSLFIPNCIAVNGINLSKVREISQDPGNVVLIFDDQPRNEFVVRAMDKCIDAGYNVVIWDNNTGVKLDINDMVKSGMDHMKMIEERTFSGLLAKLEISKWRKV